MVGVSRATSPYTGLTDFPVLQDWVTAAEAASMAGVSRQFIHARAATFRSTHRLSPSEGSNGYLVFDRQEIADWVLQRAEDRRWDVASYA